jgi:hypothetical protein
LDINTIFKIFEQKIDQKHYIATPIKSVAIAGMKKTITLIALLFACLYGFSEEIVLKGVYQGKNLYVMNPFAASGVGFCVFEVTVNGQVTTDEINSSAFEIDLTIFQFKKGDKLVVVIKYKDGCTPKIINPEVIKPQSTFEVTTLKIIDKDSKLTWTTTGESGSLTFVVEQFRWNKWVKVGQVEGVGTASANTYSVDVNLHSGYNRFRIKQVDYTRKPRYSKELKQRSMQPEITYTFNKPYTEINFSGETMYEIYDYYGVLVDKGVGVKVDVSSIPKGDYFLNYDTKTETIKKK